MYRRSLGRVHDHFRGDLQEQGAVQHNLQEKMPQDSISNVQKRAGMI
jgi:hypothetical protein